MYRRKRMFLNEMRGFCDQGRKLFNNLFNCIENYVEYEEGRLIGSGQRKYTENEEPVILKLTNKLTGDYVKYNLTGDNEFVEKEVARRKSNTEVVSNTKRIEPKKEEQPMKYLTKRADGRWQARKTINGKRICVYGKTQEEARQKLKKLSKRKAYTKRESFYSFSIWWLKTYKLGNVAESTYKGYYITIKAHLKISTPINKVTTKQLQEILSKLSATRIREEVYKLMRQICKKAYQLDYIQKDISQFLEKGKITRTVKRALTVSEQKKLVDALGNDMFSRRVMLYLCTGARPAELMTIKKKEVRPGWVKLNGTKTKNSIRWVKVSEKISNMVLDESPEFFKFNAKRFREHLQRVSVKAGIDYAIDTYTLRHTFATNLYILRVPEKDRQMYMGHSPGSKITNAVYTTFSPDITKKDIYDIYGDWYPNFDTNNSLSFDTNFDTN